MHQLQIQLPSGTHPAYIGQGILNKAEVWPAPSGQNRQALVCMDPAVSRLWPAIQQGLAAAGWQATCLELAGGEQLKDFQTLYPLYGTLLAQGLQRRSLLVAVGGGTIGDAVGFLAATYLRGIAWASVPTTALAQVDSCLGGKTGINHAAGKNLIGAFHQPASLICDTGVLAALPAREWVSGLGEMLKYGLIHDPAFWDWLLQHQSALLAGDLELMSAAVARSLAIKAWFVAQDERDLSGVRAALNFGHTFGHALEQAAGYGYYRHGEAVILGMSLACQVSAELGLLAKASAQACRQALEALPLPPLPEEISAELLLSNMQHDKKNDGSGLHCLLLQTPGQILSQSCSPETLQPMLSRCLQVWRA